ncbi:MAG: glycosyltransferase [Bacteroidales bacterium]|jgi:glycosyltransferase involved in cell wall biosynthesis|nr:glycosyltransferase [Bacteroidales bacterium]
MPAVSVITPVYNTAPFIERCVRSLMEQTFQDIEYIFVDDNTPDNSIEILQTVLKEYPDRNVQIITHNTNKGLAAARRTGIDNAKGDYILMCDSDDYVEHNMVLLLYEKAVKENADIAVCDMYDEYGDYRILCEDLVVDNRVENFKNLLVHEKTQASLVNKLVRKHLFDNPETIVPQGVSYLEDFFVTLRLYYFANIIVKVNVPLYHYVKYNTNAITRNVTERHFQDAIIFYKTLKEFLASQSNMQNHTLTAQTMHEIITALEVQTKLRLLWGVRNAKLRYKYSAIFSESEKQLRKTVKLSDKLMLYFSRSNDLYGITSLLKYAMEIKHRLSSQA